MHRSHSMVSERPRLLNYDTREMILTARLYETEGLRLGDIIYILDKDPDHRKYKNAYIVGKAEVFSIFETEFQGWMMKARGNFSMVGSNHFIARNRNREKRAEAWALYKKGDQEQSSGNLVAAYSSFKKSYDADPQKPETWMRLAQLSIKSGRDSAARQYIKGAWERLNRFQNTEDVLNLPGLYLAQELKYLQNSSLSSQKKLKSYLELLNEVHKYSRKLEWYSASFSPKVLSMLKSKGLPVAEFHLQMGKLFDRIAFMLRTNSIQKIISWLNESERKILYRTVKLPYQVKKNLEPSKEWDEAFIQASFYHYRIAHELDRLDIRSAYQIIILSSKLLENEVSSIKKETYTDLIRYYGKEFLEVPSDASKMDRVRILVNAASQLR